MTISRRDQAESAPAADPSGPEPIAGGGPAARLPWAEIVRFAALGTLALLAFVFVDVQRYGGGNPISLIQPGTEGVSAPLMAREFPQIEAPEGLGLDGQLYYAIAREPVHLEKAAESLDRPRYRLQRPMLSWMARIVHPMATGGVGLIWALFFVGVLAVFGGSLAAGALSTILRGPPWVAALFAIAPGAYWSLRVTVSDALALALALGAVALAARSRHLPAIALGVLAVLSKEPAVLVLIGWTMWRRTFRDALVTAVPIGVAGLWAVWLRITLPGTENTTADFGLPFAGVLEAWNNLWSNGNELVGMACAVGGFALGFAALAVRRFSHPLSWIIAVQLAYLSIMGPNPIGTNFGPTRMAMPIMLVSIIALLTPDAARAVPRTRLTLPRRHPT